MIPAKDTVQIDTFSIVPGSEILISYYKGEVLQPSVLQLEILYAEAQLVIRNKFLPDSIVLSYKVFPNLFTQKYFHKNPEELEQAELIMKPYIINQNQTSPYLDVKGLNYNGSLTRGISFGNNQDVVVNSTFNLQMSGKLQNDVEVSAAITESNIPIQPEGNTQQLQEFDKVFIRLSKNKQALTVGDFELYKPESYFMNFYKKSQGGLYEGVFQTNNNATYSTNVSLAVSKGIYVRQDIAITEGNQGPYKLYGVNNETFIIILAGTERVYIDGKLLTRGAENDYVIDYNAAEISFTVNQRLTKDKRVNIEFEYSDKNYFRSLAYWKNTYTSADNKLRVQLHAYSEQDSKNQPVDQTLDSLGRSTLEAAGDSVQDAFISSIDTIPFDGGRIMYKMVDTLGYDSVFVYSTNADSAKYVLVFSTVGTNRGNYVQTISTANGRVYAWVEPVAGVPQGYAEPVILLAAPEKNQMVTMSGEYKIDDRNIVSSEVAFTNADVNTFSEIDNADNEGVGIHTKYQNSLHLDSNKLLLSSIYYEFAGKSFSPIERYRPVEFTRDWNIFSSDKTNEHYAAADFSLSGMEHLTLAVNSSVFARENFYTGFKQNINSLYHSKGWQLKIEGSFLTSSADTIRSEFFRPKAELIKIYPKLHNWQTGLRFEAEHNSLFAETDSLQSGSFFYNQYEAFVQSSDTAKNKLGFSALLRDDKIPVSGIFTELTRGVTYSMHGALYKNPTNTLSWQVSHRTLRISDTSLTTLEPEQSLLGRLQHSLVVRKGFFTSDIFYETGTGQEPKREYAFLEVEPGQGVYTWNDYNANGVPELNEFETSVFTDEANYIQVFVPTEEYVQSNTLNTNYAVSINPKAIWFNEKGLKNFISRFAAQSSLQFNKKVIDDEGFSSYNPFAVTEDSDLVSSNVYFLNTIFFNRTSSVFGIDYSYQNNFNKTLIVNGPESRGKDEHKLIARYRILQELTINATATSGSKTLSSIAFPDKNYSIPYYTLEPKLTYISNAKFRVSTLYQFTGSTNSEGTEILRSHEATVDTRYNVVSKSTVNAKFSYVNVLFEGVEESPVGYAMLEGLQNGNNLLCNITFERKLSQVLQLSVSYDGRKTGDADIIHVGRVQMRALF